MQRPERGILGSFKEKKKALVAGLGWIEKEKREKGYKLGKKRC